MNNIIQIFLKVKNKGCNRYNAQTVYFVSKHWIIKKCLSIPNMGGIWREDTNFQDLISGSWDRRIKNTNLCIISVTRIIGLDTFQTRSGVDILHTKSHPYPLYTNSSLFEHSQLKLRIQFTHQRHYEILITVYSLNWSSWNNCMFTIPYTQVVKSHRFILT